MSNVFTPPARSLHLNAFGIGYGFHPAAWRHKSVNPFQAWDLQHHIRVAKLAERGLFDALFIPDGQGMSVDDPTRGGGGSTKPEPLTLLSALAAVTTHLGLGATFSTTYNEPYNIARFTASLDNLSGGRAGWNIVTSQKALDALNFGAETLPSVEERYRRGEEFVEVVKGLWDTWEDGALIGDRERGVLVDASKVHQLNHKGEYYAVSGPLNVPRSPQGRPILFQAGSSEIGRDQGARHADVIFTAQADFDSAAEFYQDIHRRAKAIGRSSHELLIVPGLLPIIGSTEEEARALVRELSEHLDYDQAINSWKSFTGLDLTGVKLDEPVPDALWSSAGHNFLSRVDVLRRRAVRDKLTARQVLEQASLGVGHYTVVGTPKQVADEIERWFVGRAADGFNLLSALSPLTLETFVEHVVPLLQRKGIYRHEYPGRTLRENYGLPPAPLRKG